MAKQDFSSSLNFGTLIDALTLFFLLGTLLLVTRTGLFLLTHLFLGWGLWLFPRLLVDETLLGPFNPIFEWDKAPKESLSLKWRRFKKQILREAGIIKERKRKAKPNTIKKAKLRSMRESFH